MLRNCLKNRADVVTSPFGHRGWKSWKLRSALVSAALGKEDPEDVGVGVPLQGAEWKPRGAGSFLMALGYSGEAMPLGSSGAVFFLVKRGHQTQVILGFLGHEHPLRVF